MANRVVQSAPVVAAAPPMYPQVDELEATSFRLQKICDSRVALENEIERYKQVSKKYERARAPFTTQLR